MTRFLSSRGNLGGSIFTADAHQTLVGLLVLLLFCSLPARGFAEDSTATVKGEEIVEAAPPSRSECQAYVGPHQKGDVTALTLLGVACFEVGNYPQALDFYLQALELSHPIMLRGAIGRALHELGIYSVARYYYKDYLANAGQDEGANRIRERLREVEDQIENESESFSIKTVPPQAKVYVVLANGSWFELGQGPTEATMRRGTYELQIQHPDYHPRRVDIDLREGSGHQNVDVELIPGGAAFDMIGRQWRRTGIWTMATSTPVLIGGATLLVLSSQASKSAEEISLDGVDRSSREGLLLQRQQRYDRADKLQLWGIAGTTIGATGVLLGALFYAVGRPSAHQTDAAELSDDPQARRSIVPYVAPGKVGMTLSW